MSRFSLRAILFLLNELNELPIFGLVLWSWGGLLAQRLFIRFS